MQWATPSSIQSIQRGQVRDVIAAEGSSCWSTTRSIGQCQIAGIIGAKARVLREGDAPVGMTDEDLEGTGTISVSHERQILCWQSPQNVHSCLQVSLQEQRTSSIAASIPCRQRLDRHAWHTSSKYCRCQCRRESCAYWIPAAAGSWWPLGSNTRWATQCPVRLLEECLEAPVLLDTRKGLLRSV